MTEPELRDIDQTVLHHIQEGHNDTQKITAETTLKTHKVRYSLEKLEQLDLITIEQPDRMVERVVDGQKRVFQHPKKAELTEKGEKYLKQTERVPPETYENLSQRELAERIHQLETEMEDLKQKFEVFRSQIQQRL